MHDSFNKSLRKWSRSLFGRLFIVYSLVLFNLNCAMAVVPPSEHSNNSVASAYDSVPADDKGTPLSSISLTNSDLGITGPFSFGVGYGTLNQYSINAQYTKKINDFFALSALLEYGQETYRFGGTAGFKLSDHDLIKFSAEQFNQLLPFAFTSGNVDERMSQNAFGGRYHHGLENAIFKEINIGAYYANTPNSELDSVIFETNDVQMINYRNIAGGTSMGADANAEFQVTSTTGLSAQLYYDNLKYDTKYTDGSKYDARGLGGGLGIKQLVFERVALSGVGSVRELYNTYTVGISWLPGFMKGSEVSLLGQRIITHNETPNSTIFGLQFGYDFGFGNGSARYALSTLSMTNDVGEWTGAPAVYMDQVLAVSDEKTEFFTSTTTKSTSMAKTADESSDALSPNKGPVEGGTPVVITGENFTDVTAVKFGELNATEFTIDSPTQITAISPAAEPGVVDVTLVNPLEDRLGPIDQFTYDATLMNAGPTVTSLTPSAGPIDGGNTVVIAGTALKGATSVMFGDTATKNFIVNSATKITVVVPAGKGAVNVTVITPSGSSPTAAANVYTYQDIPTVTSISPNTGIDKGGTTVTINGTDLLGTSAVKFGKSVATSVVVVSAKQVTAKAPAGTLGTTVDVTLTTLSGTSSVTEADRYTYQTAPTVTTLSSSTGPMTGGSTIVLTGTNFLNATSVKFGTTAATSFTIDSATQITAVSPSGSGANYVTVTTPVGTSATATANQFTYQASPTVTSISPNSGLPAGSTTVTINGTNLLGTSAVKFGAADATNIVVVSATQVTAKSPAGALGSTVDITLTTPSGTSSATSADQFTYATAPTVSGLSQNAGPLTGGSSVIITGTNFNNVSAVKFGTINATSFTVNSATQITATSPSSSAATINVTVTTPIGVSATSASTQFTYAASPTVTVVAPKAGPITGGTTLTLTGTNFIGTTAVTFGDVNATSYTVVSATQISAIAPEGTDVVNILVTTPSGNSTAQPANTYTYQDVPTVTSISPNAGVPTGATTVTINGTDFLGTSAVRFGSALATSVVVVNATQITAKSPAGTAGSTADITVTTLSGTSSVTPADRYTYQTAPTVTALSASKGSTAGGSTIVLTGTNFLNTTSVKFGTTSATSFTIDSATQITAVSPSGSGAIYVTVTTPVGTSATAPTNQFTYQAPPTVTSISPNSGLPTGSTTVTINGTNFLGTTAVKFGADDATNIVVVSATQVTAKSPAGTLGSTVDITLTTPSGTSSATSADQFTYATAPTVTGLSQSAGPLTGGSSVVITGTNFNNVSAVKFGTINATSFTVNSATQITATSPASSAATINITVTTPIGVSATGSANQFTFAAAPTVTALSPTIGTALGGTSVTLTGTNFIGATAVKFGSTNAASFIINSATSITAVSPVGTDVMNITVTTPSGVSTTALANQFTYQGVPTITSISPNAGVPTGGTTVTINGTNLLGITSVNMGGVPATNLVIVSATQLTARSPAGTPSSIVDVTVSNATGTSPTSPADQFAYQSAPTLTSLSSNGGVPAGGQSVVITGTNFTNALGVSFGSVFASTFTVNSPTQITATAPANVEGTTSVRVTTAVGTSSVVTAGQYTYANAPTVTRLSVNAGLPAGGTTTVITGTNFTNASSVKFGSRNAASFTVDSATQITAVSPSGTQGNVDDITVTTPSGTSTFSSADQFSYQGLPTIESITPNAGSLSGGTTVVITGTNLSNALGVSFGATFSSSVTVNSPTQITVVSPVNTAGAANVRVTTPVGTSVIVPVAQFTYEDAPSITNITPNAGLPAGGTVVVINGANFTSATAVNFGGVPASSFVINSATKITAVSPVGTLGSSEDVIVITAVGETPVSAVNKYTYAGLPTLTSITPNAGELAGGTTVVVTGTNFTNNVAVSFGSVIATSVTVNSPTQLTVTSPPNVTGISNLRVTTPVGTSLVVPAGQYTYEDIPTVTSISPDSGLPAGGTTVIINGANFRSTTGVNFGTQAAQRFTVDSPSQITAISPPGVQDSAVDVQVTTLVGTSSISSADEFFYVEAPTVTALSPNAGMPVGGTTVVITGTHFDETTSVMFGAVAATTFVINSATQISAVAPAGIGVVNVIVTTPSGSSVPTTANEFTYQGTPTVDALSPNLGPLAGGTIVVLSGTNFFTASAVTFGTTPATSFVIDSDTQITAISPAGTGTENVTVTTLIGTSLASADNEFLYQGAPTVTSISPNAGLPAGGTSVIINGTNFLGTSAVRFGSALATGVVIVSPTQITAQSPAGIAGSLADITVTTSSGTSAITSAGRFAYEGVPSLTGITPNAGLPSGGASIVITGNNFTHAMGVSFGSVFATNYTVDSPTQITVITPPNVVGTSNVRVTTPVGTTVVTAAAQYTYQEAPTVTGISLTAGLPAGGTSVVINGANFTNATSVNFGAIAAKSFTINSATKITAISPAGTQGSAVDITVATPAGTSATLPAAQFVYEDTPVISSISPNAGVTAGGTTITITGANFTKTLGVSFGSVFSTNFTVDSATQITAVTPENVSGTTVVRVTTPVGTNGISPAAQYTYENAPTVASISPNAGNPVGGESVVINGNNFISATAVKFGDTNATSFTINSASKITAVAPAGVQGSMADVTVITPVGTSAVSSGNKFAYEGVPVIESIASNAGLPSGGETIVITGENFTHAIAVNFGTAFATSFTIDSPTQITAVSPANAEGTTTIRVTTPVGTSGIVPAAQYTYEYAPTLTSLSSNAGLPSGGTVVVINGSNFTSTNTVKFGEALASSFTVNSPKQITAVSPSAAQGSIVDITITTPIGTTSTGMASKYVYEETPTITSISLKAGLPGGGSTVVIAGTNFIHATAVNFGATAALSFTIDSANQITAVSPAGTGTVDISVITPVGTSNGSTADQFTYEDVPTVTALSPNAALPAGGTTVYITGENFIDAHDVTFGGISAASFTIDSSTQITAVSPPGTHGSSVNVAVTTSVGTSTASPSNNFIYEGAPIVSVINPNAGISAGGAVVTITGTDFLNATAVKFGAADAASFTIDSATQITAISPSGLQGSSVDITVTTPVGTSVASSSDQFMFEEVPSVTAILPLAGVPEGGSTVVIVGTDFINATGVYFGATSAASYTIDSATQITAVTPSGMQGSSVDITVTTPVGTSLVGASDQYTYQQAPTISTVSPNVGLPSGSGTVIITGTNFLHATDVNFGTVGAMSFTIDSASQITAVSPPGTGIVDMTVTTPVGVSATSANSQFTYQQEPTVLTISPNIGVPAGGTPVVIYGENFIGATGVYFSDIPADSFTVDSATQITAISPSTTSKGMKSVDNVSITVTTPLGGSPPSPSSSFVYIDPPVVTDVSPNSGLPSGGTTIVITGNYLSDVTQVNVGATPAASFTVNSATKITAVTPVGISDSTVDVTVVAPVATSAISPSAQFTFQEMPIVSSISPNIGIPSGGTLVVITGENFIDATSVKFGEAEAASYTIDSATQISAVSPPGMAGQSVHVTVTTHVGRSASSPNDRFTYDPPVITSISPKNGTETGGTTVVIKGVDFNSVLSVQFGGVDALGYTVDSPSQITAISPPGTLGQTVDVRVTSAFGTSPITLGAKFTYKVLTSIAITPPDFSLGQGTTKQLIALGTYSDHSTGNITHDVTWSSSNHAVATVNADGDVYGVTAGTSVITAQDLVTSLTASSNGTVVALPTATSSSLNPTHSMMTPIAAMMKIRTLKVLSSPVIVRPGNANDLERSAHGFKAKQVLACSIEPSAIN